MIDWIRVSELQAEVGSEAFGEVVEMFLEEVEEVTERLVTSPDQAALSDDLHFLKGSALSLGFAQFADMCHDGEKRVASQGAAAVDVSALVECYTLSKTQFLTKLAKASAAA
ncbi:Hpt domain-containing protein [Actibacterium lipolyticum]|uniref:Hpt domain protein n=1 Tax=Actibacterium lipolyticum TaxID=1524263 RepID=A0A238KYA7_9RHOB|nr:Hpt domain-containing protein [Actibacterium lipolyticum]SMX47036.1 Hpt domain protein [Actibacterium lipolyticum]